MKKHIVYGLFDPQNSELRYIGKTSRCSSRKCFHRSERGRSGKTHRALWLQKIYKDRGLLPFFLVLFEFDLEAEAFKKEVELIKFFSEHQFSLTNLSSGGEGTSGFKLTGLALERAIGNLTNLENRKKGLLTRQTQDYRESMREKMKIRNRSPEYVNPRTGKKLSEEERKRISNSVKNFISKNGPIGRNIKRKPLSEERLKRLREQMKNVRRKTPRSKKEREAASKRMKEYHEKHPHVSTETKEKISKALKEYHKRNPRKVSEETKDKIRQTRLKMFRKISKGNPAL